MTLIAPPVTGQDINLAARATRKALEVLLAEQGTSFPPLATMNVIASRGNLLSRDAVVRTLANALDVDPQSVATILHGLQSRGLVRATADDHFALTEAGVAEHQRLTDITRELTAKLYADFEPDDLAAARRVLVTLTERAEAHVAATLS
jgi:DNA-binding MarR family transcriptional regulator